MRKEFGKAIVELAEKDPNIVLIVGDIGYGIFDEFKTKFPNRYFNFGICEQSMIGAAAGMALEGLKPYVYTITPFLIERPFEQIKLDIDQQNVNVKLVGYADYPNQGPTHTELDGEYIMKLFKNINSYFPKNSPETRDAIFKSYTSNSPAFISLKKDKSNNVKNQEEIKMNQLNIITSLHQGTKRDYVSRMNDNKVTCMEIARRYSQEYWDGDRRYGYGGYRYIPRRWEPVAKQLIEKYNLTNNSKILDVGCGKAYLLFEIKKILPGCKVVGFDFSEYAINNAKEEIKERLFVHRAQDPYPFEDKEFDLVISITTFHNLYINDLKPALQEMERVGKNKYLAVESYRNDKELFNLQCWALTAEAFFKPEEWVWLFNEFGYSGDYEFIYFE